MRKFVRNIETALRSAEIQRSAHHDNTSTSQWLSIRMSGEDVTIYFTINAVRELEISGTTIPLTTEEYDVLLHACKTKLGMASGLNPVDDAVRAARLVAKIAAWRPNGTETA
jgi:hypothetical protein